MATPSGKKFSLFRFNLRSLFVLITALCVFLGYEFNWIRQRRQFLSTRFMNGKPTPGATVMFTATEYLSRKPAPPFLWLFGESGYEQIHVVIEDGMIDGAGYLHPNKERAALSRAQALFPEAEIKAYRIKGDDNEAYFVPVLIRVKTE